MKKITQEMALAFINRKSMSKSNTTVTEQGDVLLFGNKIAERRGDEVWVNFCGYNTVTTRDRVNGLCCHLETEPFYQRDGVLMRIGKAVRTNGWIKIV